MTTVTIPTEAGDAAGLASAAADATSKANAAQAAAIQRANHTGTQTSATISDFAEAVQDAVAAFLAQGTGVTLAYNDAGNSLTITAAGGGGETGLDVEAVYDAIGVALIGSGVISVVADDAGDTITISSTATANSTDAQLRDRSTHTGTQAHTTITGLGTAATVNTGTTSGDVPLLSTGGRLLPARLGSGTADATTFLRGDGTFATPAGGGGGITAADVRAMQLAQWQSPTGAIAMTIPRFVANASVTGHGSGQLRMTAINLQAGDVATSITFVTGATAGSGLTNRWAALYDSSFNLLRQSASDASATWSASTAQVYTLTSTYTITTSGVYFVGIMVAGTTIPTFSGVATLQAGANMQSPPAAGLSTTGLTTTAPNPAAALTPTGGQPLAWVS